MHQNRPIGIKLPEHVVLEVAEADAHIKGQTAASSYKGADDITVGVISRFDGNNMPICEIVGHKVAASV